MSGDPFSSSRKASSEFNAPTRCSTANVGAAGEVGQSHARLTAGSWRFKLIEPDSALGTLRLWLARTGTAQLGRLDANSQPS